MTIGEKIRAYLNSKCMTDTQLRVRLNWHKNRFSHLLNGTDQNQVLKVYHLTQEMGCDLEYLVDDSKGWPAPERSSRNLKLTEKEAELIQWIRNRTPDVTIETVWHRLLGVQPVHTDSSF